MEIYTIGFTQKTAEQFFGLIRANKIEQLIDIRLNNVSQLAGFAKKDDLCYFLRELCQAEYVHEPLLAPSEEILAAYRKSKGSWDEFEKGFLDLMMRRGVPKSIPPGLLQKRSVFLCSEHEPHHCHRRLVAELLSSHLGRCQVIHLT